MIRGRYLNSTDDTRDVFAIRSAVFGGAPGLCQLAEPGDEDAMAVYACALDESGAPTATGRLSIDEDDRFRIGCVCVLAAKRGQGYGDLVMRMLLSRAVDLNAPAIYVSSPLSTAAFFAKYGFMPIPGEEAAPFVLMRVSANDISLCGTCQRADPD